MSPEAREYCSRLPACGVLIESHHHGPDFRTEPHKHPWESLIYIVSGRGRCIIGEKQYPLGPNTAIALRKAQMHQLIDEAKKAMVVFVVYFSEQVAAANDRVLQPLLESPSPVAMPPHQAQHIRRALRQMLHEQSDKAANYEFAVRLCLSSILLEIHRGALAAGEAKSPGRAESSITRVERVLQYVTQRYYEPQSLSDAARMAHLSQRQFANICRKIASQSFSRFVNSVRIDRAAELLRSTDMPVSAIAFEVGFEELSTFYRAFKKYRKASPLAFRAQADS